MSPVDAEVDRYYTDESTARQAAVMALFMPIQDQWHLLYMKRPHHPKDKHSGQISFPGGGLEANESLEQCAIRETFEEIGVPIDSINIIGSLTKLYVYASNNLVFPYVGYLKQSVELRLQAAEVEKVIPVPMSYFDSRTDISRVKTLTVRGHTLHDVPYYDLYGETLWGATAMITSELIHLWNQDLQE